MMNNLNLKVIEGAHVSSWWFEGGEDWPIKMNVGQIFSLTEVDCLPTLLLRNDKLEICDNIILGDLISFKDGKIYGTSTPFAKVEKIFKLDSGFYIETNISNEKGSKICLKI